MHCKYTRNSRFKRLISTESRLISIEVKRVWRQSRCVWTKRACVSPKRTCFLLKAACFLLKVARVFHGRTCVSLKRACVSSEITRVSSKRACFSPQVASPRSKSAALLSFDSPILPKKDSPYLASAGRNCQSSIINCSLSLNKKTKKLFENSRKREESIHESHEKARNRKQHESFFVSLSCDS